MGTTAPRLDWDKPLIATPFDCPHCGLTLAQHRHPDGGGTVYFHADCTRPAHEWGRWDWRRFSLVVPDRAVLHRRTKGGRGIQPLVALWCDLMDWCDALHAVLDRADCWTALGGIYATPDGARRDHIRIGNLRFSGTVDVLPGGEISGITRGE